MVIIEEHTRYINYIIGVIGGLLSYALGGYDQVLEILVAMVVIDYVEITNNDSAAQDISFDWSRMGI